MNTPAPLLSKLMVKMALLGLWTVMIPGINNTIKTSYKNAKQNVWNLNTEYATMIDLFLNFGVTFRINYGKI